VGDTCVVGRHSLVRHVPCVSVSDTVVVVRSLYCVRCRFHNLCSRSTVGLTLHGVHSPTSTLLLALTHCTHTHIAVTPSSSTPLSHGTHIPPTRYYGDSARLQVVLASLHLSPQSHDIVVVDSIPCAGADPEISVARILGIAVEATAARATDTLPIPHSSPRRATSLATESARPHVQLLVSGTITTPGLKRVCARVFKSLYVPDDGGSFQRAG